MVNVIKRPGFKRQTNGKQIAVSTHSRPPRIMFDDNGNAFDPSFNARSLRSSTMNHVNVTPVNPVPTKRKRQHTNSSGKTNPNPNGTPVLSGKKKKNKRKNGMTPDSKSSKKKKLKLERDRLRKAYNRWFPSETETGNSLQTIKKEVTETSRGFDGKKVKLEPKLEF